MTKTSLISTAASSQRAYSAAPAFTAFDWKPVQKNTLRGFFSQTKTRFLAAAREAIDHLLAEEVR